MGRKIFKGILFGLLGLLINFVLLIILSLVFPQIGGWNDGFPFGLLIFTPGLLLGSLCGIILGLILGYFKDWMVMGGFICSIAGGLIGELVVLLYIQLGIW